jgi:hypothetical protein
LATFFFKNTPQLDDKKVIGYQKSIPVLQPLYSPLWLQQKARCAWYELTNNLERSGIDISRFPRSYQSCTSGRMRFFRTKRKSAGIATGASGTFYRHSISTIGQTLSARALKYAFKSITNSNWDIFLFHKT